MPASRHRVLLTVGVAVLPITVLLFVPLAALGVPGGSGQPMIDFVLDDAYITFRYASNLAAGFGPTWNPGEERVEGYTSFLWMLLAAGSEAAGIRPLASAKATSVACVLIILWLVAKRARGPGIASAIPVIGVALSPVFLLAATQGMETGLAALLAAVAMDRFLVLHGKPDRTSLLVFHGAGALACLTRPELVVVWSALTVALAVEHHRTGRGGDLRRLLGWALPLVVLPGLAFLAWRWGYYGELLPNTFFVKRQSGLVDKQGALRLVRFLIEIAAPFLILLLVSLSPGRQDEDDGKRRAALGALLAIFAFLVIGLRFRPLQGMLFRFQMPVYPALLLVLASRPAARLTGAAAGAVAASARAALVLFVALYSIGSLPEALRGMALRWQHDRAVMGRQLGAIEDRDATMLISESGALPYFSRWTATDTHGLNDTHIARHGLSREHLARVDPDLIVLLVKPGKRLAAYGPVLGHLSEGGYRFVAAVAKTDPALEIVNDHQHLYFVKRASPRAERLQAAILAAPVLRVPPAFPDEIPPAAR